MQRTAPEAHALRYTQCIMHIHANKKPVINPRYSLFHSHLPGFNHLSKVYMLHAVMWKSALLAIVCVCVFSFSRVVTLASFRLSSFWKCFFPSFCFIHFCRPWNICIKSIFLTILFQFSRRIVLNIIFCCLDFHFSSSISCSLILLFLLCRKLAAVS